MVFKIGNGGGAGGDVVGPESSTDNGIVLWDGTTGKLLKNIGTTFIGLLNSTFTGTFTSSALSENRTWTFPNNTGTVVLTSNTQTLGSKTLDNTNVSQARPVSVEVSGTSKTLALTDSNTIQACTNAATQTITIPLNASVAFPTDTTIIFEQLGAGTVTVLGDTGVTVNTVSAGSKSTGAQYTGVYARKTATNTWVVIG